jgi:hypothetical protein
MKNIIIDRCSLIGTSAIEHYEDGTIKQCILTKKNKLETIYGTLIPQYESSEERRKYVKSLSFYNNGSLKSIYLQKQTDIKTPLGNIPAELITFYENGGIKRIFPLNGKLSAYWSEEDEEKKAKKLQINLPIYKFNIKLISIYFSENGNVKSITFWPSEILKINSLIGVIECRIGLSFYEDGNIKSFEPNKPTLIETPIGKINAFNTNAFGIHGETNSVKLTKEGKVASLITSTDVIKVTNKNGECYLYRPKLKTSVISDDAFDVVTLTVEFKNNTIIINNESFFNIDENTFEINNLPLNLKSPCSDCSNCTGCCH